MDHCRLFHTTRCSRAATRNFAVYLITCSLRTLHAATMFIRYTYRLHTPPPVLLFYRHPPHLLRLLPHITVDICHPHGYAVTHTHRVYFTCVCVLFSHYRTCPSFTYLEGSSVFFSIPRRVGPSGQLPLIPRDERLPGGLLFPQPCSGIDYFLLLFQPVEPVG